MIERRLYTSGRRTFMLVKTFPSVNAHILRQSNFRVRFVWAAWDGQLLTTDQPTVVKMYTTAISLLVGFYREIVWSDKRQPSASLNIFNTNLLRH